MPGFSDSDLTFIIFVRDAFTDGVKGWVEKLSFHLLQRLLFIYWQDLMLSGMVSFLLVPVVGIRIFHLH